MAMLQLRVVCPDDWADDVEAILETEVGSIALMRAKSSDGAVLTVDVARESVGPLLDRLRERGVLDRGMVSLVPLDTAIGVLAERAEDAAPGQGADALIWDDLAARTGEDSVLTWTFLAFMVLATLLAAIGVVTDSTVTIVGAMVVGPEFGPLAGLAVALLRRQPSAARRSAMALGIGFTLAVVATAALALLGRAGGLFDVETVGKHDQTEFIYHPGWFSLPGW
jgi:hypothetical protein